MEHPFAHWMALTYIPDDNFHSLSIVIVKHMFICILQRNAEQRNTMTSDTPLDEGMCNASSLFLALNNSVIFAYLVMVLYNSVKSLNIDVAPNKFIIPTLHGKACGPNAKKRNDLDLVVRHSTSSGHASPLISIWAARKGVQTLKKEIFSHSINSKIIIHKRQMQ